MTYKMEFPRARRFFRNRPHRLKTIALLPSMITLVNGICGFTAIGLMSRGPDYYSAAAYMIFYAMIADVLDGRVARISKTTSSFGGQLDSLCDVISFGAAPAFLMLSLLLHHHRQLVGSAQLFLGDFFERFIWLAAVTYLSCAAVRLARFNVENEEDEASHMSFSGLPSPGSAGVIAALVMYSEYLLHDEAANRPLFVFLHQTILYVLPFVTFACGFLMVSRMRYPHLFNRIFRGRKPLNYLYSAIFVAGIIFLCGLQLSLVLTFGAFALSGPVRWLWYTVILKWCLHRSPSAQPAHLPSQP
ncbi:MAG: phosphatidylcholine/phosphatidylserine synthase [Planctomycetaceae bacterium]|nr:phosphatidylcholine/phosphatidylserine synthase [Planctomycetaceae bacterium]